MTVYYKHLFWNTGLKIQTYCQWKRRHHEVQVTQSESFRKAISKTWSTPASIIMKLKKFGSTSARHKVGSLTQWSVRVRFIGPLKRYLLEGWPCRWHFINQAFKVKWLDRSHSRKKDIWQPNWNLSNGIFKDSKNMREKLRVSWKNWSLPSQATKAWGGCILLQECSDRGAAWKLSNRYTKPAPECTEMLILAPMDEIARSSACNVLTSTRRGFDPSVML